MFLRAWYSRLDDWPDIASKAPGWQPSPFLYYYYHIIEVDPSLKCKEICLELLLNVDHHSIPTCTQIPTFFTPPPTSKLRTMDHDARIEAAISD